MDDDIQQKLVIIPDPSCILSRHNLKDLTEVLSELQLLGTNFEVLLPNLLHSSLDYLEKGLQQDTIERLVGAHRTWLPSKSESDARQMLQDLATDEEYKKLIRV